MNANFGGGMMRSRMNYRSKNMNLNRMKVSKRKIKRITDGQATTEYIERQYMNDDMTKTIQPFWYELALHLQAH